MIKLYSFGPAFGLPDPSPFVLKVDLFMRMNGIDFESVPGADNLRRAPKGKLPFIEDDGQCIADSTFIIEYLTDKYSLTMDDWLSDEQRATAQLIGKSLDENFYWCIVHSRWMREDTWPLVRSTFFDDLPVPLKQIIPILARRSTKSQIINHGMGKHNNEEINSIARHTLSSLSALLGDKPWMLGDRPCTLDITVFSMVSELVLVSIDNEMNTFAREYDNLVRYSQRILQQYYPDLQQAA